MRPLTYIAILFYISGLLIYLYGFMSFKSSLFKYSNSYSIPQEPHCRINYSIPNEFKTKPLYTPLFDKTVLVVIDALRSDFLTFSHNESHFSMPFVENLVKTNKGVAFISRAKAPTVTLPRIKSLLTGKTTSYIDTIYNFHAYSLKEDNIIYQAKMNKKRIVFYGDDTWLKLFPSSFVRSEGTTSFFVSDYTEVDDNVTRHLDAELAILDWDLMVLHYLGVDHIGHSHSPQSALLPAKLLEMDSVLARIYRGLQRAGLGALVVVTGDHGMTPQGNHGGPSPWETLTPLVFLSTLPGVLSHSVPPGTLVNQVDVAATLATLLGLPIPFDNTGAAIPLTRLFHSPLHQLFSSHYNALQLCQNLSPNLCQHFFEKSFKLYQNAVDKCTDAAINPAINTLTEALQKASGHLSGTSDNYNMCAILVGMGIAFQALLSMVCLPEDKVFRPLNYKLVLSIFISCSVLYSLDMLVNVLVATLVFVSTLVSLSLILSFNWSRCLKTVDWSHLATLLHILSLASSSLIEEEHLTWYYLTATTLFLGFLQNGKRNLLALCVFRIMTAWNSTGYQWADALDLADWLADHRLCSQLVFYASILLMLYLVSLLCRETHQKLAVVVCVLAVVLCKIFLLSPPFYVVWLCLAGLVGLGAPKAVVWILWATHLSKVSNVTLLAGHLAIHHLLDSTSPHCAWQLAMSAFFLQGNSNSLATVDVASAYAGLSAYRPLVVGMQLASLTYAGPVLWILFLEASPRQPGSWKRPLLAQRFLTNLIYLAVVTVHRYHLFIWSVFAPKLLYECALTLVLCATLVVASSLGQVGMNTLSKSKDPTEEC